MSIRRGTHLNNLKRHRKQNLRAIRKISTTGRNGGKRAGIIAILVMVLLVLAALFLTLNETVFGISSIPTWDDILSVFDGEKGVASADGMVSVHYIDVGQGDSELIVAGNETVLIDSGESEYANTVIAYINNLGIKTLDYVVVTHPHSDHAGGMSEILDEFKPNTIIMPKLPNELIPTTSTYTKLLGAINRNGVKLMYPKNGDKIQLEDGGELRFCAPLNDYDDLNDQSVVFKFVYGENSFLFTGDIEENAEDDILSAGIDISADVLKIAHHGSSTSSKKKFLRAVSPTYAVIEVGSPNTYNHPNEKVLSRIADTGAELFRTDIDGNIVFTSDGKMLSITTEKEADAA